ncbi:hypothetical protein INT48_000294 [Thamnidium elegans]|uniref:Ricin B lectin domain-containing protein n=1 Tax=Thamnidium elegans TaxID=101142 RepID=A0A8H7STN8_9FUNG|nr:hypothetical protein INT48_000294 [Thamnidium elegans]
MEAVPNFPDGFFFIRCKHQPFAMDVNMGSMLNDASIIIWPQKMVDSINQLWMHEEGFLINKKSGLVIDIKGGGIEREKLIIQYARKPGLAQNQRWTYRDGYICSSSAPHLVLDIRGGEYKNGNNIYLNAKNLHSQTQQWIIQPFQNEKSNAELSLLRPSPRKVSLLLRVTLLLLLLLSSLTIIIVQRTSTFPRQEELYDCYRLVYLESGKTVTPEQLAGAAAFKGLKDYIDLVKKEGPIIADENTRKELVNQIQREVIQVLHSNQVNSDINELVTSAKTVAESYFIREYGNQ